MLKVDGVFSGGGVKGVAFIGALEEIEKKGFQFERLAGTSAGSIVAALTAANYKAEDLQKMITSLDFSELLVESKWSKAFPFMKWIRLYYQLGLYKGDGLEAWLHKKLEDRGIRSFNDLPKDKLKIIGTDVSLNKMVVFPDDVERYYGIDGMKFSVAKAVRISCSIPFFFIPTKLKHHFSEKSLLVDGGFLSNFPIWLFTKDGKRKRPILGLQLSTSYQELRERNISGAIDFYKELFTTMMKAHDARYINKEIKKDVMFIPIEHVEATDFDISIKEKEELMKIGREYARSFLRKWSY